MAKQFILTERKVKEYSNLYKSLAQKLKEKDMEYGSYFYKRMYMDYNWIIDWWDFGGIICEPYRNDKGCWRWRCYEFDSKGNFLHFWSAPFQDMYLEIIKIKGMI